MSMYLLALLETKLKFFLIGQFKIPGYTCPFHLDCDQHNGEIMVYIWEDIPVKFLSAESKPIESLYIVLNFRRKKRLLSCSYNPNRNNMHDKNA